MTQIIDVRGPLIPNDYKWIYDIFEMECTCPNDISMTLQSALEKQDDIVLRINSPGGYVTVGADMYELIRSSKVNVEARIVGNCCSAATYLACAANRATMSPLGQYMIHRSAISGAGGNTNDFASIVESLNETDKAIAYTYSLKTGLSQEEIIELMDKTTWMNATTAKSYGFIDEILFSDVTDQTINIVNSKPINTEQDYLINEAIVRNMIANKENVLKQKNKDLLNTEKAKMNLKLLELGGYI